MGSPISGFLADVFINFLETKFFHDFPIIAEKIVYYFRYVDDTLLLINGDETVINEIINKFNTLHSKITFTAEIGTVGSINFLDLIISNKMESTCSTYIGKPPLQI